MKQLIPFVFLLAACQKSGTIAESDSNPTTAAPAGFVTTPEVISIKKGAIPEASGVADSKANPGYLWVEQDSGNPAYIYLLSHDGTLTDSVFISGASNRDWEDIARVDDQLYIGDIGDNSLVCTNYIFYRFAEPVMGTKKVTTVDMIRFAYPDGAHDAEAFLVDPSTKDIYVFTKRDQASRVYKLAYPQSTTTVNKAEYITDLSYNGIVSAAISPEGNEVILKTYTSLYYYRKDAKDGMINIWSKAPTMLSYQLEVQGEAIGFHAQNKGFFTLSEKALGVTPTLNYYKRKD